MTPAEWYARHGAPVFRRRSLGLTAQCIVPFNPNRYLLLLLPSSANVRMWPFNPDNFDSTLGETPLTGAQIFAQGQYGSLLTVEWWVDSTVLPAAITVGEGLFAEEEVNYVQYNPISGTFRLDPALDTALNHLDTGFAAESITDSDYLEWFRRGGRGMDQLRSARRS